MRSRAGRYGKEPCSFCLGRRELFVTGIIERCEVTGVCRFQVRVTDGRRFVIRHQPAADLWELDAVYAPSAARPRSRTSRRLGHAPGAAGR